MINASSKHLSHNSSSAILTGIAAVLLLFICISSPVVSSMRMYQISNTFDGAIRYVQVGLWGYCVQPLKFGYNSFTFDPTVDEGCSRSHIGFSLDSNVANALKTPGLDGLYSKSFTALLVLFPIATALSAMTCILQTTIHFFGKTRGMKLDISSKEIRGIFYYNLFTLLLVLFAFVVQLAVLLVGRARVLYLSLENPRLRYHGENTPWLSGFAVLCHLIDLCIINSWRKERLNSEKNKKAEKAAKKSKNKAVVEPSHDQDVVGKLEEIGKLDESEAVTPPQYHLDGYVLEKDDSSKEKHSTTL